jgi:hypothetical protein
MPVDALNFTGNDTVETFDTVTARTGVEWKEVSVLMQPGKHTLSWSYQYFGLPNKDKAGSNCAGAAGYVIDPRRARNLWVNAIILKAYTGDAAVPDNGATARMSPTSGPWFQTPTLPAQMPSPMRVYTPSCGPLWPDPPVASSPLPSTPTSVPPMTPSSSTWMVFPWWPSPIPQAPGRCGTCSLT